MARFFVLIAFFVPVIAAAQSTPRTFKEFLFRLIDFIDLVVPILIALTMLYIFWYGAETIRGAGSPDKLTSGRTKLLWGVVALFVMTSVWGLVRIVMVTFGLL